MLKADQLSGHRGEKPLFKALSFSLFSGQGVYITGQNGIGKTTLLEALAGLNDYVKGSVSFFDNSLRPEDSLFIGTRHGFKDCLSVEENLSFWASVYDEKEEKIQEALCLFKLKTLEEVPYADLSTGQKQRLSLSRLCLVNRSLWLLDEPFSGLDESGVTVLTKRLEKHLESGGYVCMTSHSSFSLAVPIQRLNLDDFRDRELQSYEKEVLSYYV